MSDAYENARLAPVRRSWNPMVWLIAWAYRMTIGRVAAPVPILFARVPRIIFGHLMLLSAAEYGLSLDRRLRHLARVFGSRVNLCMFCDDLETHMALKAKSVTREDIDALAQYGTSPRLTERERAALRYVEEINTTRSATDETFMALKGQFTEKEIAELTWLNAVGNYLNLMAKPLGIGSEGFCTVPMPAETTQAGESAPGERRERRVV
jgi:alkylhydroperoxidase family enzyme